MKNFSVTKLIDFRRGKTDYSKKSLVQKILNPADDKNANGGGDYWITSMSAIRHAYRERDNRFIEEKIYSLSERYETSTYEPSKLMYERNRSILYEFEDFDFSTLYPPYDVKFMDKEKKSMNLNLDGIGIKTKFHELYSFNESSTEMIGATLFVSKLDSYDDVELGLFAECLYIHLSKIIAPIYSLSISDIRVIDLSSGRVISYDMIKKGQIPSILNSTISKIKKFI